MTRTGSRSSSTTVKNGSLGASWGTLIWLDNPSPRRSPRIARRFAHAAKSRSRAAVPAHKSHFVQGDSHRGGSAPVEILSCVMGRVYLES